MAFIRAPFYASPRISTNKIPPTEHDHARFIDMMLHDLNRRCGDFKAALALFDECTAFLENLSNHMHKPEEYHNRWHWRGFAAREAATTIYRVSECLTAANKSLGQCPVLRTLVDRQIKRNAMKAFAQYFPGIAGVRHGIQHYAKLYGTLADFSLHAIPDQPNFVNDLTGRTMRTVFEKKHVEFEISEATLDKLYEVRSLYWDAFMSVGITH